MWGCELKSCDTGQSPMLGSCENGHESLGSIKDTVILD